MKRQIWSVLTRLEKALVEKDAVAFIQLLSDDFVGATPAGESLTKDSYINHHCRPDFGIVSLTGSDLNAATIRIFNDTAVVNRRVHSIFKSPTGKILNYDVQRIEVLVVQNHEWVLVSGQGTQVMQLAQPH